MMKICSKCKETVAVICRVGITGVTWFFIVHSYHVARLYSYKTSMHIHKSIHLSSRVRVSFGYSFSSSRVLWGSTVTSWKEKENWINIPSNKIKITIFFQEMIIDDANIIKHMSQNTPLPQL